MRKNSIKVLVGLLFVLTILPNLAFANSNEDSVEELDQLQIDKLIEEKFSYNPQDLRAATEEETDLIVDTANEILEENPKAVIDVDKLLDELNLSDVTVETEEELNQGTIIQPMVALGGVGFQNFSRDSKLFNAQPQVINYLPLTTIDQIGGYIKTYSILPGTSSYLLQKKAYYSIAKVKTGVTKVGGKLSVPHYNRNAKMTMDGIVLDGGKTTAVTNTIVSKTNGSFTN